MQLPPCIRKMLSNFKPDYASIIASFFRTYGNNFQTAASHLMRYGPEVIGAVAEAWGNAGYFSCDAVTELDPNLCEKEFCPLASGLDPVELADNLIERVVFVSETNDLILYFKNSDERLVVDVVRARRNSREFASQMWVKTASLLGNPIDLFPYRDPDTKQRFEPAVDLLSRLMKRAEKVVSTDPYGIGETIINILSIEPVFSYKEARFRDDVKVIVKEKNGTYALYIDTAYFRLRLRAVIGNQAQNPWRINSLLAGYGIRQKQVRVGSEKRYFYEVPNETMVKLTGKNIAELITPSSVESIVEELEGVDV